MVALKWILRMSWDAIVSFTIILFEGCSKVPFRIYYSILLIMVWMSLSPLSTLSSSTLVCANNWNVARRNSRRASEGGARWHYCLGIAFLFEASASSPRHHPGSKRPPHLLSTKCDRLYGGPGTCDPGWAIAVKDPHANLQTLVSDAPVWRVKLHCTVYIWHLNMNHDNHW